MRDTVDIGIDLGTTNSAIAMVSGGTVSVLKNNDNMEITPSVVSMPRPGEIRVGRPARADLTTDQENAHAEFKLLMGQSDITRTFPRAGVTWTPQQLSAEVLTSLRADAAVRLGEPPDSAVITVPAAFRLHQINATSEAARLAGFTGTCQLIQEPTAAAFAYGFQNQDTDAYWMVFDFGGGTFDSAVVTTRDGELRVVHHAGDAHLGGKLIDRAIVDRLLLPALVADLGLPDLNPADPAFKPTLADLKVGAEEAKIALSRRTAHTVVVNVRRNDENLGIFEYALTRDELDRVAEPFYLRAVNLCRDALTAAHLRPADIDKLLLVGGVTLAPGLRELLADPRRGLGIALDHSQDPTTVVACGAAVYAGTVPLERPFVAPAAGRFGVELDYPRTTSLSAVTVSGRLHGDPADWTGYHVTLSCDSDEDRPFRSPRIAVAADGTFAAEVRVTRLGASTVRIELTGPAGSPARLEPDSLTVQRWVNEPAAQVLTHTIGVAQASGRLEPMVDKGRALPAEVSKMFHTTTGLSRSEPDGAIRIPIMEGERGRADRNLTVAVIEIRPDDLPIDLPKGADIEITVTIDASRLVTAVAEVAVLAETFDAVVDLEHVPTPAVADLRRRLTEAETRSARLRAEVRRTAAPGAAGRLARLDAEEALETARSEVNAADGDEGAAAGADERLRDIMAELDDVEAELALPEALAQVERLLLDCRDLVDRLGDDSDRAELAAIERGLAAARRDGDGTVVAALKERTGEFYADLLRRDGNALDTGLYEALCHLEARMEQPTRARQLIRAGEVALATRDWAALRDVNQRLVGLLPDDVLPPDLPGGVIHGDGDR